MNIFGIIKNSKFGVAGFPPNFFKTSFGKKREGIFPWLASLGLDALEVQCTYGVKMPDSTALLYNELSKQHGIHLSIHAPYYVTLASDDAAIAQRSKDRLKQCIHLAHKLDAKRIVFHPGHFKGQCDAALDKIINALLSIDTDIPLCPETIGRPVQIGSLDEILIICKNVKTTRPCIDLAHIHAFANGCLKTADDIVGVFNKIESVLTHDALAGLHMHVYPVGVDKNGEKGHKAFGDSVENEQCMLFENHDRQYYPDPQHFISAVIAKNATPTVICEALNSQEIGAGLLRDILNSKSK